MARRNQRCTSPREWAAKAAAILNADPAATTSRLARIPARLDALAARAAAIPGPLEPADHAELCGRLAAIERAVHTWHELRRDPELAECLESTRPAIEAAERLLSAAGRPRDT